MISVISQDFVLMGVTVTRQYGVVDRIFETGFFRRNNFVKILDDRLSPLCLLRIHAEEYCNDLIGIDSVCF